MVRNFYLKHFKKSNYEKNITCFVACVFLTQTEAQKCKAKDVPPPVMDAFKKEYPAVKKVYWGKDGIHYHAGFFDGKVPGSVTFDIMGKRLITEMQMPVEDLPQPVRDYVEKNYSGEIFKEVARITDADGMITYEVEVKDMDLIFDAKGNFIQALKCYD